jgi:rubrerythrin
MKASRAVEVVRDASGVPGRFPAELVRRGCGYGVVVPAPPSRCPMCGVSSWAVRRSGA